MPKRLFDLTVGLVLAVLAIPVVFVLAIGVTCSLRCWPFFAHQRVGRGSELFACLKLRTLPRTFPRFAVKGEIDPAQMRPFLRFLRSHHLDELPQLLLVPLGVMSLVGPRPEMRHLHAAGDAEFAERRAAVRPGCTGLWQIGLGASKLIWEAPEYDCFYLEQSSLRLDIWILWRSALLMLGLASPVSLNDIPVWTLRRRRPTPDLVSHTAEAMASSALVTD